MPWVNLTPDEQASLSAMLKDRGDDILANKIADAAVGDDAIREQARFEHGSDAVEIDCEAIVSHGDTGAWVMAWVYVETGPIEEED